MPPRLGSSVGTRDRRQRFVEFLRVVGDGESCIYWPWSIQRGKYVRISGQPGITHAHRWVWEQVNGPVPDDYEVCHNCPNGDDPACCRPSHLWLGTHAENIQDGFAKGRMHGNRENHPWGEGHWATRLTTDDVYRIRREGLVRGGQSRLAREFGMSRVQINKIARRKSWTALPEEP